MPPDETNDLLREIRDLLAEGRKKNDEYVARQEQSSQWQQKYQNQYRKASWLRFIFFLLYGLLIFVLAALIWQ